MSIFGKIGTWLIGLFNKTRPGLETFLADHHDQAIKIMEDLAAQFAGTPMNQWRDKAFAVMGAAVGGIENNPGTWISLLIDLGYDVVRANQAKASQS